MSAISYVYTSLTKILRIKKCANIHFGNIFCKLFYRKAVFYQWNSSIECWLFIPHNTHLYVSIKMSLNKG